MVKMIYVAIKDYDEVDKVDYVCDNDIGDNTENNGFGNAGDDAYDDGGDDGDGDDDDDDDDDDLYIMVKCMYVTKK